MNTNNKSDYWAGMIRDWRASGLTKKNFCRDKGISHDAMGYWITKLKSRKPIPGDLLVPVSLQDDCQGNVTLHLSNGLSVTFGPDVQPSYISRIVSTLTQAAK